MIKLFSKMKAKSFHSQGFQKVMEIEPRYSKAYIHRGLLYARIGEKSIAVVDLKKGLAEDFNLSEKSVEEAKNVLQKIEL
jgi:hypothetical protein